MYAIRSYYGLTNQDILSVSQFDRDKLDYVFTRAREMREMVQSINGTDLLKGYVLACLFYEPRITSYNVCYTKLLR